jgi:hypothetical protein
MAHDSAIRFYVSASTTGTIVVILLDDISGPALSSDGLDYVIQALETLTSILEDIFSPRVIVTSIGKLD